MHTLCFTLSTYVFVNPNYSSQCSLQIPFQFVLNILLMDEYYLEEKVT